MKLFILEGVVASGKTSVFTSFQKILADSNPNSSKIFFTEHLSQRVIEHIDDISEKRALAKKHLKAIAQFIKHLAEIYSDSKFKNRKSDFVILFIERFLLSYLVENVININFALKILAEINMANPIQFLLTISKNHMLRRVESTLKFRNEAWKKHLAELSSKVDVGQYFNQQQEKMQELSLNFAKTMPTLNINTDNQDYSLYSKEILNYLVGLS